MEPANHEEEVATKDQAVMLVVKGKRTKRVRPHSPMPVVSVDTLAKSDSSPSPETSAETNTAEEDQDMANCLILLAQGPSPVVRHVRPLTRQPPASPSEDVGVGSSAYKYTSRRFLESSAPTTGKGGYYVYECKTCNRTFPSFQALGGHRASHKKPKAQAANSDEDHHEHRDQLQERQVQSQVVKPINTVSSSTALSLQLRNNPYGTNPNYKSSNGNGKVHECSICGAEFTSGQALGGHMRRHRSAPTATALTLSTPLTATRPRSDDIIPDDRDEHDVRHGKRARSHVLSLDLDLNLPAPEDDHRESKFGGGVSSKQPQQQKQSSLVFSAPALVDCHY